MMMISTAPLRLAKRHAARGFAAAAGKEYDVVVVGGGPGGYVAAIKAAQLGLSAACVEMRGTLGGTCLNVGCIPSKALLHASHLYEEAKHGLDKYGINISGDVTVDIPTMMGSKHKAVSGLTGGIEMLLKKNKVDYIKGYGKLLSGSEVSVALAEGGNETLNTKHVIIATGSEVSTLPPVPVNNEGLRVVDSDGAIALEEVPKKMVVIGGGVIGLELGSVWRRLGAEVTVVEFMDKILPGMDDEVRKKSQQIFKKQGMKFKLATKVTASDERSDGVTLTMEKLKDGSEEKMDCDVVLVSTGRRAFTKGLGLENIGIELDQMGRIPVANAPGADFRTALPTVHAIGDCIEGPMLAHKAEEDGIAAVENIAAILNGKTPAGHVNYDCIPGVVYTHPEIASCGKTEEQLKEANVEYNTGSFPFQANSRARANDDADGFVKILAEKDTDRIVGIHIIGPNAGEMIAEGVLGMEYGASSEDIARTCHAHPTLSEAFKEAAMSVADKPIHF